VYHPRGLKLADNPGTRPVFVCLDKVGPTWHETGGGDDDDDDDDDDDLMT
jgi:hypothetical protein